MRPSKPPVLKPSGALTEDLKSKGRRRRSQLQRLAEVAAVRAVRNDMLPALVLESVPLEALRVPSRRLRKADAAHVREIANSIGMFGVCDPILIGKDNLVLDGEIRLDAVKLLGLATIPCIRIDHLNDTQQRTLRLAVNRLAEKGTWDLDLLKVEFEEIILLDAPVELTGFALEEIDSILCDENVEGSEFGPLEPEAGAIAVARVGDVFQLGSHRIVCGDARDPEMLTKVMRDTPAARLVLTDEPYNVRIAGHVTGGDHREFEMATGEMSPAEFLEFNVQWLAAAMNHVSEGGLLATFIDWRGLSVVQAAAEKLGLDLLNLIVWSKTNAGMGSLYRSQHELMPLFKKGRAPHVNNVDLGKSGRWRSNVWVYPGASSIGSDARRGLKEHPTVKPTAMLEDAFLDLTHRGDVVIDPFLGSGSALMACEATGRVVRGIEIDPLYIDVTIRRFEARTSRSAVHEGTGEPYASLSEIRRTAVRDATA